MPLLQPQFNPARSLMAELTQATKKDPKKISELLNARGLDLDKTVDLLQESTYTDDATLKMKVVDLLLKLHGVKVEQEVKSMPAINIVFSNGGPHGIQGEDDVIDILIPR